MEFGKVFTVDRKKIWPGQALGRSTKTRLKINLSQLKTFFEKISKICKTQDKSLFPKFVDFRSFISKDIFCP